MKIDNIGKQVLTLRKQNNMTQKELADALQVSHQVISKWETGMGIPETTMIVKIANLFDVTIDTLVSANYSETKKNRTISFFKGKGVLLHIVVILQNKRITISYFLSTIIIIAMIVGGSVGAVYSTLLLLLCYVGIFLLILLHVVILGYFFFRIKKPRNTEIHYTCDDNQITHQTTTYSWGEAKSFISFGQYALVYFPKKAIIVLLDDLPSLKKARNIKKIGAVIGYSIYGLLTSICGGIIFAYYFILYERGVQYAYDSFNTILPVTLLFLILILVLSMVQHRYKKHAIVLLHCLYIFIIYLCTNPMISNIETIRSSSPNGQHTVVIKRDIKNQQITYYKQPGLLFMTKTMFGLPNKENVTVKSVAVDWLTNDLCLITLQNNDGATYHTLDGFNDTTQIDLLSILSGIWKSADEEDRYTLDLYYSQNSNITLTTDTQEKHFSSTETSYKAGQYIGLQENNTLQYCLSLNDDWQFDTKGKVRTPGSIILSIFDGKEHHSITLYNQERKKEVTKMTAPILLSEMNRKLQEDPTLENVINDYDMVAFTCENEDMFIVAKEALRAHNEANYKNQFSSIESGIYAMYIKAGNEDDFYITISVQQRYITKKVDGFPEDSNYLANEERSFRIKKNGNRYIAGNMTPYEYDAGYEDIEELIEPLTKNTSTDNEFSFTIEKE